MVQARLAAEALAGRFPEHEFVPTPLQTHGDRHPALPLTDSSREGIFVKELEQALLDGRVELAVHSAKDLPTQPTPGLTLAAFLERADARDALIARPPGGLLDLPPGSRIGTGSPRRAAQIAAVRPDLRAVEIRGNVDTRLRRLAEGMVDALVLAAAGLQRLGRLDEAHELLPFEVMLPAPGQGALAVQAVEGSEAAHLAAAVNAKTASRAVLAERALLRRLGGGCLSAIGAYAVVDGSELFLRAVVLEATGGRMVRAQARGASDQEVIDLVLAALQDQGAVALLKGRRAPLQGLKVLVTRAGHQAGDLARDLAAEGATVVACPVIRIEPIAVDPGLLLSLADYDWLVLTSANGVVRLAELMEDAGGKFPAHIKVAAIGPQTAEQCRRLGIEPALVPERYIAEDLADDLVATMSLGSRVLLARASGSRDVLPQRLQAAGAVVDLMETYRAVPTPDLPVRLAASLPGIDLVTLTSSSTVRHFAGALPGPLPAGVQVACIGPVTAQTAVELGLRVDIIAQEFTTRGLVDAIVRSRTPVSA
jgi:hydroxymethylbilane synthase